MALTPKQQRFVEEYLIDLNATQAAIRAGYAATNADVTGPRLLGNVGVAEAIEARRAKVTNRLEITQERVLRELARIAFVDVRSLFTWDEKRACYVPSHELSEDEAAVVSQIKAETTHHTSREGDSETTIKLELKTYDKLGALEKLGKHLGMFVNRHEHYGELHHKLQAMPPDELKRVEHMSDDEIRALIGSSGSND